MNAINQQLPETMMPPCKICDCKCFFKCKEFSVDQIKKHFYEFYEKNYNEQTSFLSSLMELIDPQRKRVKDGNSNRNVTVNYFLLRQNGKKERVCKKMICHTYQITQRRIQMLVEKLKNGIDINDQRGKHENRPHKILVEEKLNSVDHTLSSQEVHYNNDFNNTLKTEHNLEFDFSKSDYCNEHFDSGGENSSISLHEKSEKGFAQFGNDSNADVDSDSTIALRIDLQQVTFTPSLNQPDVLQQRPYSTYNFTIETLPHNKVDVYTWHETVANAGATEITSCLYKHISCYYSMLEKGDTRKLTIWSNRHIGEFNIWTINSLCHSLLTKFFSEINQEFLTSDHSITIDQDFALIGKSEKDSEVFVPAEVSHLTESTRQTKAFKVHQMDLEDFKNFAILQISIYKELKCEINDDI